MIPEIPGHEITVSYTTDDDGLWACCECGWRGQVPGYEFWPTPEMLVVLADGHRAMA